MLAQGGRFLFGLVTGLLVGGLLYWLLEKPRGVAVELLPPPTAAPVQVHVAGAVADPGLYVLPPASVVADALAAAGGALPGADLDQINLASPVNSGEQVRVPMEGTVRPTGISGASQDGRVNLNTANAAELETLPGIGPTLANAIIRYRDENGPFYDVEDLIQVPGIGPTRMSQLRDFLQIE